MKRRCATPACERAPRTSGRDGQTLHAHCDACEQALINRMMKGPAR